MKQLINYLKNLSRITKFVLILVLFLGVINLFLQSITPIQDDTPIIHSIFPKFERGIYENSNFTISFTQVLGTNKQKNLEFEIIPYVKANKYWLENNYQYHFNLSELMINNKKYTINIKYKNKQIFTHTFITDEFNEQERKAHILQQGIDDQLFSQAQKQQEQDFPWISIIPIITDEFIIVYNYEKEKFRIRLKIPENSSEEIRINLINKALKEMRDNNIDPDQWGYYILYS